MVNGDRVPSLWMMLQGYLLLILAQMVALLDETKSLLDYKKMKHSILQYI